MTASLEELAVVIQIICFTLAVVKMYNTTTVDFLHIILLYSILYVYIIGWCEMFLD